jgi:N-formylglutamate deformylase
MLTLPGGRPRSALVLSYPMPSQPASCGTACAWQLLPARPTSTRGQEAEPKKMDLFHLHVGDGPLVAAAIHNGHAVRSEVAERLALDDATRLREEDPFTGELAALAPTRIVGLRSRFEMDLNRPRDKAVYLDPEDAWGLDVWRETPPDSLVAEAQSNYDLFFATTRGLLEHLIAQHGRVVVLDLHSYNHRRDGSDGPEADPVENPVVNVGTASIDRAVWGPLVNRFLADLGACKVRDQPLDVRENVKFFGGHFPRWIHATFPGEVCALAVEFKKTFMDEWTGVLDPPYFNGLQRALASTFPGLITALHAMGPPPNAARQRVPVAP